MAFEDIANNDKFGHLYRNDPAFNFGVKRYLKLPSIADLYPKMKLVVRNNKLGWNYAPLGRDHMSSLNDASDAARSGSLLRSTRTYTGRADTYFSGAASNAIANDIFGAMGLKTVVSTYDMKDLTSLNAFLDRHKEDDTFDSKGRKIKTGEFQGLVITNKEKVNVLEVFKDDKRLTRSQIQEQIHKIPDVNADGLMKRLRNVFADRSMVTVGSQVQNIFGFDPVAYINAINPIAAANIRDMAESEWILEMMRKDAKGYISNPEKDLGSLGAHLHDLYKKSVDSLSYKSMSAMKRRDKVLRAQAYAHIDSGRTDLGNNLLDLLNRQRENKYIGGHSIILQQGKMTFKGHEALISDDEFVRHARAAGHTGTKKEILALDLMTSAEHIKREIIANEGVNYYSQDPLKPGTPARSNIGAAAIHQKTMADPNFFYESTVKEIEQHIKDITSGEMTPGIRNLLRNISDKELRGMTDFELKGALDSNAFSQRLLRLVDTGVEFKGNDFVQGQLFEAMSKHYTRVRDGRILSFNGQQIPNYELSFAMEGSIRAHVSNLAEEDQLSGMARYDPISGRHLITQSDFVRDFAAGGGWDLDDDIYNGQLSYDPKTRRLIDTFFRDPTETSEYLLKDADIVYNKAFPQEIRNLAKKSREYEHIIRKNINKPDLVNKYTKLRDEIKPILHDFYSGRTVQITRIVNGESLTESFTQSFVRQVDFAQRYALGDYRRNSAPKGYRTTEASLAGYSEPSFLRSNYTSEELFSRSKYKTVEDLVSSELAEEGTSKAGRMPSEYAGSSYSEFHERYFGGNTFMDAAKAKQSSILKELEAGNLDELTVERLTGEIEALHSLGTSVNAQNALDITFQNYASGLSDEKFKIFSDLWENSKLEHVGREDLIDRAVKSGQTSLGKAAVEMAEIRNEYFGNILGHMHVLNPTLAGIDPIDYQKFVKNNSLGDAAFKRGFAAVAGDEANFLMSDIDPKAFTSGQMHKELDIKQMLKDRKIMVEEAARAENLEALKKLDFTSEEMVRGQRFIEIMKQAAEDKRTAFGNTAEEMLAGLQEYIDTYIDTGRVLDLDTDAAGMRALYGWDLFDEIRDSTGVLTKLGQNIDSDRQILAVSHILASNGASSKMLMGIGPIFDVYHSAFQRQITGPNQIAEIDKIDSLKGLNEYFFFNKQTERYSYTEKAGKIFDPTRRDIALLDKLNTLNSVEDISKKMSKRISNRSDFLLENIRRNGQMFPEDFDDYKGAVQSALLEHREARPEYYHNPTLIGREHDVPGAPGAKRLASREAADNVADDVAKGASMFKKMTGAREGFQRLMKEPIARKGLIGAGLFAGFGILHRLAKNPSPEEMEGPPLLPGGGPYDNVPTANYGDISSMYSSIGSQNAGQSMLYQIQANGDFNPQELSGGISRLTGSSVSGSVHNQQRTTSGRPSARQLLQSYMG